jgi:hypothetical protein
MEHELVSYEHAYLADYFCRLYLHQQLAQERKPSCLDPERGNFKTWIRWRVEV